MMSRILDNVRADARALHQANLMDEITMREIDALCLPEAKRFTPGEIVQIRNDAGMSQAVFALVLNVGTSTVQKWENGAKRPSGAAVRLLDVVARKGVDTLLDKPAKIARRGAAR